MSDPTSIPMYKPEEIEPKWQHRWDADKLYHSDIDPDKPKFYALTMLPYPLRRPAHRSLVRDDALRFPGALQADAGLQRDVPNGLRCLRPAG